MTSRENLIRQVDELISAGEELLKNSNAEGKGKVDRKMFSEWRTRAMSFIERSFKKQNIYLENFKKEVEYPEKQFVEVGVGILRAVKKDIESGDYAQ